MISSRALAPLSSILDGSSRASLLSWESVGYWWCFCIDPETLTSPALPVVLAHSGLIQVEAMIMSVVGGLLIYGTIISFGMFFQEEQDF